MSNLPQGMLFKLFRLYVDCLPPDKPKGVEVDWPVYGPAEMRMRIPELGKNETFPVRGFDMRFATRPGSPLIVVTSAPLRWFDEATARDIGVIMARWRKENEPPPMTPDDVNRMLADASGKGG